MNDYNTVKKEFEKDHFKVMSPLSYVQIKGDKMTIRTKSELLGAYENKYYTKVLKTTKQGGAEVVEKKKCVFINDWLRDEDARTYEELVFEPCQKVFTDQYNLWDGWRASKLEKNGLKFENSLMYKHFKYIFGEEMFEYAMDCFAHIVQVGGKTDVCILLQSMPGTGKDTTFNYFGNKILGSKYYLNEDHIDMLIGGNFNEDISQKVLIVLNESKRNKTDEIVEAIKNAITREENSIRIKKEKTRREKNNINWALLTNNHDSYKVEKDDRRMVARKIPHTYKGKPKYYNNLFNEINSGKYDRACYDFLNDRKIKVENFQADRPITEYYTDLQERNIPVAAQFLVNVMHEETNKVVLEESATIFYNRYCLFLKSNGFEFKTNITKFGLDMKQYDVVKKINTKRGRVYKINLKELERYLITEKYYTLTDDVEEVNTTSQDQLLDYNDIVDISAKYVRAEEYLKLLQQVEELKQNNTQKEDKEDVPKKKDKPKEDKEDTPKKKKKEVSPKKKDKPKEEKEDIPKKKKKDNPKEDHEDKPKSVYEKLFKKNNNETVQKENIPDNEPTTFEDFEDIANDMLAYF